MITAAREYPSGTPGHDEAIESATIIATDWLNQAQAGQVMSDTGIASSVLKLIATFPCAPERAEDIAVKTIELAWTNKNYDELRAAVIKHKDTLHRISASAKATCYAKVRERMFVPLKTEDEVTFPASVRRIGKLLCQAAGSDTFIDLAVILLPKSGAVFWCYLDTMMSTAIWEGSRRFIRYVFSFLKDAFISSPKDRPLLLDSLKAWIAIAVAAKKPDVEQIIDEFRESLVKLISIVAPYGHEAEAKAKKRKEPCEPHIDAGVNANADAATDDDDNTTIKTHAADAELPSGDDDVTEDENDDGGSENKAGGRMIPGTMGAFLLANFQNARNKKDWISARDLSDAVGQWGRTAGKAVMYNGNIGRATRKAFPGIKVKNVGRYMYYNLVKI